MRSRWSIIQGTSGRERFRSVELAELSFIKEGEQYSLGLLPFNRASETLWKLCHRPGARPPRETRRSPCGFDIRTAVGSTRRYFTFFFFFLADDVHVSPTTTERGQSAVGPPNYRAAKCKKNPYQFFFFLGVKISPDQLALVTALLRHLSTC